MDKIKIVRIIARLNIGGPAINASILSTRLNKDAFRTKVLYGSLAEGEGGLEHLMRAEGVDMELIPELGREISFTNDLTALWKIFKVLRRERPDIVHTHTAKAGTLGRIAAIFAGVKVRIHTFHGNVFKHYFGKIKTSIFIMIEKFLGLFTTKVVTVSERQKEELVKEFGIIPEEKCRVIPLGIDFSRLSDKAPGRCLRKDLGLGEDVLMVGIMGRLVPVKNHRMFLEVARSVRMSRPDIKVKYAVIGGGELGAQLKELAASLGLSDEVYFLGWREDLGSIYRELDVVALTSLNEGTPLALIEAMAIGKAIIATDVGGVPDIIQDGKTGIIVHSGDIDMFAKNLINILDDKALRNKLGESAVQGAGKFSPDNLVKAATELYMECVRA